MSKLRTSAIAAAAILILAHVLVLASATAPTRHPCGEIGLTRSRRSWRPWYAGRHRAAPDHSAGASGVWCPLQPADRDRAGLYTYYYDYLHAPLGTIWPSDVLVFFWVVPIFMTLFLSPRDPGSWDIGWLRVCDFAQVCTLALAVELSQIYVPSRWQAAGQAMELRAMHAGIFFFGLIAVSFIVRGLLGRTSVERRHSLAHGSVPYGPCHRSQRNALLAGLRTLSAGRVARSFVDIELLPVDRDCGNVECTKRLNRKLSHSSRGLRLLAQFSPLLIPAIVFPLVLSIAQEQFWWSVVLVLVSFAAASGRLFVVQNQLLVSSHELEKKSRAAAGHHRRHDRRGFRQRPAGQIHHDQLGGRAISRPRACPI